MKKVKYMFILFYNLFVVLFLLIFFELLIRLFCPNIILSGTDRSLIKENLYFSSPGLAPNSSGLSMGTLKVVNEYGFLKYGKPIKSNSTKWLLLGDSVTMGAGIENDSTFAGLINGSLNNIDVLNTSFIGYSVRDYFNIFNKLIDQNRPELKNLEAVLIFWTLNDFYSNYPRNDVPGISDTNPFFAIANFFRTHFKSYHWLKNLISDRSKAYFEYDFRFYNEQNKELLNAVDMINKISTGCQERKVKCIIFLLPYEYQIRNWDKRDVFKPQDIMKKLLQSSSNSLRVIDCREAFEGCKNRSREFYLYGDGMHFSKEGHKKISEYILKVMQP